MSSRSESDLDHANDSRAMTVDAGSGRAKPDVPWRGAARAFKSVKIEHLVAGVSGGVISTLILHPLDLLKIRFAGNFICTFLKLNHDSSCPLQSMMGDWPLDLNTPASLTPAAPLSGTKESQGCTRASPPTSPGLEWPGAFTFYCKLINAVCF